MRQGDICVYHFSDGNGSVVIAEIQEVKDETKICPKRRTRLYKYYK